MRPLPKTLQRLVADNRDKFDDGHTEQDGFGRQDGWSYWLYLNPGWINSATETHCIHECTVKEVKAMFRAVVKCSCEDCRRSQANGENR